MVHWGWLVVTAIISGVLGAGMMACCAAAGEADRKIEQMQEIKKVA